MKKERIYEITLYGEQMQILDVIVDGFPSLYDAYKFAKGCLFDLDDVSFYNVVVYPTCFVKYVEE